MTKKEFLKTVTILGFFLIVGLISVFSLRHELVKDQLWPWMLLIFVMVVTGFLLKRIEPLLYHNEMDLRLSSDASQKSKNIGILLIIFSILITFLICYKLWPDYNNWHGTFIPWVLSIFLILIGSFLIKSIGEKSTRVISIRGYWPKNNKFKKFEIIAFLFIFLLAIILRIYNLDNIPPGFFIDEPNAGLDALYIIEGRQVSPFGTGWYGTPNGYIYYMAGILKLFGANWISLKIISLIPAILTIPALFILTKLIFGPIPGLIAMLLMAVSRWHLTMSRWGWNETAPPLFQILALFFLIRGLRDRRALDYSLSGLISGLMVYTYLSSRLALFTIFLFIVYWFFTNPIGWRGSLKKSWSGIFLFSLALMIAIGPILVTYVTDPFTFSNRINEITILRDINEQKSITPLIDNLMDALKFFHHTGDFNGRHNLPGEPMADPFTGLFFAIGLFYAIIKLRDYRFFLLLIWLIIGLSAGFLSLNHQSPQAYRTLNALPAVTMLAAVSIDLFARLFNLAIKQKSVKHLPRVVKNIPIIFIVIVLVAASLWEIDTYFNKQAKSISVLSDFNPMENGVAHEVVQAYQSQMSIYVSPEFSYFSPLRYLMYGEVKNTTGQNSLDDMPYKVILPEVNLPVPFTNQDVILLLDYQYYPLLNYFLNIYPKANINLVRLPNDVPIYMKVEISKEQVEKVQGVIQRIHNTSGKITEKKVDVIEWNADIQSPVEVEWEGLLRLENGSVINLMAESNIDIFIDNKPWTSSKYLGRGIYHLKVIKQKENNDTFHLSWKIQDHDLEPIPPDAFFTIPNERNGLLSSYYRNLNWEGSPVFQQITPFLLLAWPDQNPIVDESDFSARFTGSIKIDEPGEYIFKLQADDGARFIIDGVELGAGLIPNQPNDFEVKTQLTKGRHSIQIDYFQQGGGSSLRLFWQFGDNPLVPIPPEVFNPN